MQLRAKVLEIWFFDVKREYITSFEGVTLGHANMQTEKIEELENSNQML